MGFFSSSSLRGKAVNFKNDNDFNGNGYNSDVVYILKSGDQ